MENFSYHVPFYVVTGGIDAAGHSSDLKPGEVGLFDRQNFSVATGTGSARELFFAQGNNGGKDWYGNPVSESHKSPFFLGKDVENMYLSKPQRLQNEEWVIGYNGSASSKSLSFEKGKPVRVKLYLHGQPAYRFFGGPKEYVVSYTPAVDAESPCAGSDCPDPIVDCLQHSQALVDKINNNVELKKFGIHAKLVNAPYTAATATEEIFTLEIYDNGDSLALQAVQAQAPAGVTVERIARDGAKSTYQFCQSQDASAPADFQQSASILAAVCGSCPAGSTLTAAKDVYIIRRTVTPSTDLTTDTARDNYADTVGTAYDATAADADKTFVGLDGSVAIVKLKVATGTSISALVSDTVEFSHTEEATCTFAAPAATAWVSKGVTGIKSKRKLRINSLNRLDCSDGDRLADLTAILTGVKGILIGTLTKIAGTGCVDDYTVEQDSLDCLDEACLSNNVTFTYDELPAFENKSWEVVPPVVAEDATRKCGIRISAGYWDPKNSNCTFDITSYYESEPVKFEVSLLGEDDGTDDIAKWPTVHQSKVGKIARQSGEWVIREVVHKDAAYLKHVAMYDNDPLMREKFDINIVGRVDRNAFYNLYYVTFGASYGKSFRKNEQEKFTAVFAFKEGDPAQEDFKSRIVDVLTAKSGVVMHINS